MIKEIINPALVKICKVNEENINILNKEYENLATQTGFQVIILKEKVLTHTKLDKSLTVCTNKQCFRTERIVEDGKEVTKRLYDPICCDDCKVPFTSHDESGSIMLFFCQAMDWNGNCKVCQHPRAEHVHIAYELDEAKRRFKMETKDIKVRKMDLELELGVIIDALAFFSQYLDCHSMFQEKGFVDMFIEMELTKAIQDLGLEVRLHSELQKNIQGMEDVDLEHLRSLIRDYQKTYDVIEERILLLKVEEEVKFNHVYEVYDKEANDLACYYYLRKTKDQLLNHDGMTDFESPDLLETQQESVLKSIKDSCFKYSVIEGYAQSQKRIKEKTMLVDGLKKMQQRYVEKATCKRSRDTLTPESCQQIIIMLGEIKHNGPIFKEIHEKLAQSKNKGLLEPKQYKIGLDNIPKQYFNQIGRAVEKVF